MKLKYFLTCLILFLSTILWVNPALAFEKITNYTSDIIVNEDGTLDVTENITVITEQNVFKHGIYKDFFTDRIIGNTFAQRYINFSAFIDSKPTQTSTKYVNSNLRVYVGDPDTILNPGTYTFTLKYTVLNEISFYEDHDELFFNVNGPWNVFIDKISGSVQIPSKFAKDNLKFIGFQGPIGSKNQINNFTFRNNTFYYFPKPLNSWEISTLKPEEVVTVGVWFPKGTFNRDIINADQDKFDPKLAHVVPLILLAISTIFVLIFFKPNNFKALLAAAPVNFDIPKEFSPADFRYIMNKKSDTKSLTAILVNLAIKKAIKIQKDEESKDSENLVITELDRNLTDSELEKQIIKILFDEKDVIKTTYKEDQKKILEASNTISLSCFSKKYISFTNPINRQLTMFLQYFLATFILWNANNIIPNQNLYVLTPTSIGLVIASIFIVAVIRDFNEGYWANLITLVPVFLGVSFFNSLLFPKLPLSAVILFFLSAAPYIIFELKNSFDIYSEEGLKLKMLQLGFLRFVNTQKDYLFAVEKDIPLTFNMYETYLPYAIALDVETQWSQKFNEVLKNITAEQKLELDKFNSYNLIIIDRSVSQSINNYYVSEGLRQARSSTFSSGGGFSGGGSSGGGGGSAGGGGW